MPLVTARSQPTTLLTPAMAGLLERIRRAQRVPLHAMTPTDAFSHIARRKTERVPIDELEGRITTSLITPYPPGIPLLVPGEVFNRKIVEGMAAGSVKG